MEVKVEMARNPNTDRSGNSFSETTKLFVWSKGLADPKYKPEYVRRDACGALIEWVNYGSTTTHGWEIDHKLAIANGGGDELANLQPLQWENNRTKGDSTSSKYCKITG